MKKIYLLFCVFSCAFVANAQTFLDPGMETWTSGTAGSATIHSPIYWYGFDSVILAEGATFAPLLHPGTPWQGSAQNFQETTIVHGGSSSAKLITLKQDTLGLFPGILTNAVLSVNTSALLGIFLTGTGSPLDALSFSGGTGVSQKIKTVSAWVQYKPGVDSTGAAGNDTGLVTVEAIGFIAGKDSILGTGFVQIIPTGSSWVQVVDSIIYTDTVDAVDTIRVEFASSGGGAAAALDSSTLYVDDVTMRAASEGVQAISVNNDVVKVYPNPASNTLYIDCLQNTGLTCTIYAANGQAVMAKQLVANNALDIAALPAGFYFYAISDSKGNLVQKGKVTLDK